MAFICPQCQVENRPNAKYCRKCGQPRSLLEKMAQAADPQQAERPQQTERSHQTEQSAERSQQIERSPHQTEQSQQSNQTDQPPSTQNQPAVAVTDYPVQEIPPELEEATYVQQIGPNGEETNPACPSCWATLRFTDKFCCWCGEPQPNRILPHMKICLACKSLLPDKANYCYLCGEDVTLPNRRKVVAPTELFYEESSEFFPRFDA